MKKIILLLTFIICLLLCACVTAEEDPLFIAQEGWKQGVINKTGEWVVQPVYERIWPFTDAGYAVVEPDEEYRSQEVDLYNHFILVDRQGDIAADLPEWRLCNFFEPNPADERVNGAGSAFVLAPMENEDGCCALYLADTGKIIMLDREFLGCALSSEAEEYVKQHKKWLLYPSNFILAEWNDRLVLYYEYTDYEIISSDNQEFNELYCSGFIIMDQQGNKVHEGYFIGEPDGLIPLDQREYSTERKYIIEGSCLLLDYGINENSDHLWSLIDRNGKVILRDILSPSEWDEGLQAVSLGREGAVLLNGEQISEDEYLKRRAALNPCGIAMVGYKYYDTQGKQVEWPELGKYRAVSDFSTDGLAWVELDGVSSLINMKGQIIANDVLPVPDYMYLQQFTGYRTATFPSGCECAFDEKNGKYGYINPAGGMMYGGLVFDYAEPFRNGAAHIKIMDDNYALLDAYLDAEGRVIWAENGKKETVQHRLDEGILYNIEDMSLEEARQAMVGEWNGGGGEYLHFQTFFDDDGTCGGVFETQQWTLLENTWGEDAFDGAPFVLVYGEQDISGKPENGTGIWFYNRDYFMAVDDEGTRFVSRVSPDYWERCWEKYDSWFQSEHTDEKEE